MSPVHVLHAQADLSILPTETADNRQVPGTSATNTTGGLGGSGGSGPSTPEAEPRLSSGAIAGIAIGVLLGALLVALSAFLVWRKRRAEGRAGGERTAELYGGEEEKRRHEVDASEKWPVDVNSPSSPAEMMAVRSQSPRIPMELPG